MVEILTYVIVIAFIIAAVISGFLVAASLIAGAFDALTSLLEDDD